MKFGNNLGHLSIREWTWYNLDYNDIKHKIRLLTQKGSYTVEELYEDFVHNFNRISLFIETQHDELDRKLTFFEANLYRLKDESNSNAMVRQINLDEIFFQTIEVSVVLKKLLKFIIVQKIACRKILKKLLKYHKDKKEAAEFGAKVKGILNRDEKSFINFDLNVITLKLIMLFNSIRAERYKLCKTTSKKLISSMSMVEHLTDSLLFDRDSFVKKNFKLDCLILDDENNLNELLLNLNIYLGFNNLNNSLALISCTYLYNDSVMDEPSLIITHQDQPLSLLISYIGGLRKYSYSKIPNDIVCLLLQYLIDPSKNEILKKLPSIDKDKLTEITVNSVLRHKLVPKLKYVCRRTRFSLQNDNDLHQEYDQFNRMEDDYLITLDQDIYTTSKVDLIISQSFDNICEQYEKFPFNKLTIHTNDLNLSNLESNLLTEISNNKLTNKFQMSLVRKVHPKIQQLIQMNSLSLFKNLDIYQYMLSCYFNVIPEDKYINNHYSSLLNLNLYKFLENVENFHNTLDIESKLIRSTSSLAVKHKSSLKDYCDNNSVEGSYFKTQGLLSSYPLDSVTSNNTEPTRTYTPTTTKIPEHMKRQSSYPVLMNFDNSDEYDMLAKPNMFDYNRLVYFNYDFNDSILNNFILTIIKLKDRASRVSHDVESYGSMEDNFEVYQKDPSIFCQSKYSEYQDQFEYDFDKVLSFFYFSLTFISLFISGIEIGIVYSISETQQDMDKFLISQNIWLILILLIGLIVSSCLCLISLILVFRRFNPCPVSHYSIISIGTLFIAGSFIWSLCTLFS